MSSLQNALEHYQARIGTKIGISSWVTVDQQMIDAFADTTRDNQWIHTDPKRAASETPFGGTIAHGFLTLSLASGFAQECFQPMPGQVMGINYGLNKLRFLSPVKVGSRLRGQFTLQGISVRSDTELLRETLLTIQIEGAERPALVAEWLGISVFRD
ncbi:MaoC family dehydratase [Paracoccus methylarcula]|uniref:MaoC family dehydratase n=1 Tax=Paracoccus methylarcula TaxID=72022 RepID=A0A3R7P3U0_9RHOB|nr:MaoC family dehydratase [Paracoccus methylarcula]RNF33947.1 MaoC family dehydratase [Paracoccus methylarcula]